MKFRRSPLFACILVFLNIVSAAQDRPIGYWRSHLPYSNCIGLATDGVTLYAISRESFFTYNTASYEMTPYSKVEGMADINMSSIGYDENTGIVVLAYKNSNIDLFSDGTFFNIPDIKLKSIAGSKAINSIYTENGVAYLSTDFGVVVLNLVKRETKETYSFTESGQAFSVRCFGALDNNFYAVTEKGLFKASKSNPNLQATSSWQLVDANPDLTSIAEKNGKLFVCTADTVYQVMPGGLQPVYRTARKIQQLDPASAGIWIEEVSPTTFHGCILLMDTALQIVDSANAYGRVVHVVESSDGKRWGGDDYMGIWLLGQDQYAYYRPQGPAGSTAFDILADHGSVWVAHGGFTELRGPTFNTKGFSHFYDGKWKAYNKETYPIFDDSLVDFVTMAKDPLDGRLYVGSQRSGLFILNPDDTYRYLKQDTIFEEIIGDPNAYAETGLAIDLDGNLWIAQSGTYHDLIVKTKDGAWYRYAGAAAGSVVADMAVDDYNQKWYIVPKGGGVAVYNDNHTPDNASDDAYARMTISDGLPSNNTFSIVKDRQGAIWVGTDDGIAIINCPDQATQGTCPAEKRIVQYDQFAGYLFQNEVVRTMAVDGANRKWVGTNNGVWLLSPEADKIISRFTAENSPLPSNVIRKITIDQVTGDVYIGTEQGLVSYRGTSTDASVAATNVISYPNPVPSGYNATIAIKGLPENADVRITDIAGQLVYRTTALGGQAVWSGLDYTGHRPQSGVYLIFVTNKDGSQTHVGKMVFME